MATTFKCQPTIDNPCLDADSIISGGGEIVQQIDGSVMVWVNTTDGLEPYNGINTKPCCEYLGYIFDVENQKCIWEDVSCDTCEMKIVINPNGDDGEVFFVGENSECSLDISLDYIFKFDCDVLSSGNTINEEVIAIQNEIDQLTNTLTSKEELIPGLSAACEQYTAIYTAMCYTIRITNHLPILDSTGFYDSKTSKGDIRLPSTNITICCLSDDGLLRWQSILGDVKYNAWLNTNGCDTTIYTNAQANQLFTEGNALAENNNGINPYLLNTEDGLCDKQEAFLIAQEVCNEYQSVLDEIEEITNQITELQNQLDVLAEDGILCNDPIANLENFQAWFSLDVETDVPMLYETVYEEQIFGIGEGNLMQYILDNNPLTGIIISGETGVLPPFSVESTCDYDEVCKSKRDTFIRELYLTQYLPLFGEPENSLENKELLDLMGGWYNSSWLNYSTFINDPDVIEKIKNRKIRISIKVNTCCLDFGILLDNIKVTQNCQILDNTAIKVTKPIGFELDKFVDNKKSWVLNELPDRRTFYLDWRNTEYNIKHGKLAINTKEIDLNIDPAKALEGDLFNYLNQNECLLDCTNGSTVLEFSTNIDFQTILDVEIQNCVDCSNCFYQNQFENYQCFDLMNDEPYEFQFQNGAPTGDTLSCDVEVKWGIRATLNDNLIYENLEFYSGNTNTSIPSEELYLLQLNNIANSSNLIFINNNGIGSFIDTFECGETGLSGSRLKVDLTITVETCEPKKFEDDDCFFFMDGDEYTFEDNE
jgi:hypothetical protein